MMFTTKTNPILTDARKVRDEGRSYRDIWIAFSYAYTEAHHFITTDFERITDGPTLVHAYKVLSRLARLERS